MKTMIYKVGGSERVWNTSAHVKVIGREDLAKYLADGWVDHPSKLTESLQEQEQEQEQEQGGTGDDLIGEAETPKRGRKSKAAADETDN